MARYSGQRTSRSTSGNWIPMRGDPDGIGAAYELGSARAVADIGWAAMSRTGPILVLAITLALAVASPALAYDTGPHSELTRDAMGAEGFRDDAIGVAQVNNWFVDLYENSSKLPYSGHGGFWRRLLTGAIRSEHWRDDVVAAADRTHFDSSTTYLFNTAGVTHEWDRLRRAVWTIAREARDQNDPAKLLTVLGVSLHQVQDFYTHTNWMEPGGIARRRGPRLGRSRLRHQSDVVRHTGRQARRGHDLHREHPGSSPAARQLAQRPQQEPDQEHEQGLAGPPAVARVGDLGVLRLAPVGRGGAVVGRRRRLLAARPGLSGGSGRPEPRPQGLLHHLAVRRPLAG